MVFCRRLALGAPETAGVSHFWFSPRAWRWGHLRLQGLRSTFAVFWAHEKAGVR